MRKITLLLNIVMLSLLIMGIAYAEWSTGFALAATVNAGECDINVYAGDVLLPKYVTGDIKNISNTRDLEVKINNIYPGAEIIYDFDVENTGTMGVHLDQLNFEIENTSEPGMEDYFDVSYAFGLPTLLDEDDFVYEDEFVQELILKKLDLNKIETISVKVIFDPNDLLTEDQFEKETLSFKLTINYSQFD
ncbi:hypothetical protein EZV73_22155 [Acidaminobacter sp. JC074]|uniref:hypothetical protein n=1 Tax=Acidaminobacter sp. JC074 TaxID=2530199 RepID=UPI001F0DD21B|nr:hypothetical protein [Acidaminobacter sp. JC074]MCH4890302.1 hypothetical protein [Acidaminobacter sp. JC074]